MLKLPTKIFSFHLPHLELPHAMKFSTVEDDGDELVTAIFDNEIEPWDLDDSVDKTSLDSYWKDIEADIHKDPTWFEFANEDI